MLIRHVPLFVNREEPTIWFCISWCFILRYLYHTNRIGCQRCLCNLNWDLQAIVGYNFTLTWLEQPDGGEWAYKYSSLGTLEEMALKWMKVQDIRFSMDMFPMFFERISSLLKRGRWMIVATWYCRALDRCDMTETDRLLAEQTVLGIWEGWRWFGSVPLAAESWDLYCIVNEQRKTGWYLGCQRNRPSNNDEWMRR